MKRTYAILMVLAGLIIVHSAVAEADIAFKVSYTVLGSAADRTENFSKYFFTRLDARPGFAAEAFTGKQPEVWDKPPAGMAPENWISLVQVAFGDRDDWLAMVFDGPGGALSYAGRRPAQRRMTEGIFIESIPPGPDQVDRNSVIELAGDFFHEYPAWKKQGPRPALRVEVRRQATESNRDGEASLLKGGPEMGGSMPRPEFEGLRALALAAACRSGWSPTTGNAEHALELEVSRQVLHYAVKARYISPKGKQEIVKTGLPQDELYESLVRLLAELMPARRRGVDFASVDMWPVRPVWVEKDLLAVEQGDSLKGFNMATGERKWVLLSPERRNYRFAARPVPKGLSPVFIYSPSLAPVSLADGKRLGVKRGLAAASYSWGFEVSSDGWTVSASDARLCMYETEDLRWEYAGPMEWTAGPCLVGGRVLAGGRSGQIAALDAKDGKVQWTAALGQRLHGPMAVVGDVVVVGSLEGTLFGVSARDGKTAWTLALGDAVVAGPYATPQGFFLASGNRRLWLVDPASGKVKAMREWPDPILAAAPLAKRAGYVCSDSRSRVAFLKSADLATARQVDLRVPLTPGVLPVGDMLREWGARDELAPRGEGVIVGDENGFVHLVAADEHEEGLADDLGL
jgi:hypothetical protein